MKQVSVIMPLIAALVCCSVARADESAELKKEVEALRQEVAALREATAEKAKQEAPAVDRRAGMRKKNAAASKIYTREQLQEIEELYQSANSNLKAPDAKTKLLSLVEKYPKANRSGCAMMYLGQSAEGAEKEKYLKRAIADFGDCFYGDGVQVGAYARYYLGYYYQEAGKTTEAKALFDEIRKDYPDAVNHKGKPLVDLLPKEK